jgi:TatD DNase family protein
MAVLYDTHAHLASRRFAKDLPEVIARARSAGIERIIAIGTDLADSQRSIEIAEAHPEVFAVVGWHPTGVLQAPPDIRPALRELARHPKVVALGETGLDHFHLPSTGRLGATSVDDEQYKQQQRTLFRQHLEVAAESGLNCVIHQRGAFQEAVAELSPFARRVRGVFHCFANGPAEIRLVLELGSLVSFTGIVTYANGGDVREALAATPLEQFMLETDCPYLTPAPYLKKVRCEPAHVREIAETVARIKRVTLAQLALTTCATAQQFFRGLPGR